MLATQLSQRQRGDFQTPEHLAQLVWSTVDVSHYDLIVEPTFGKGSFLSTLPNGPYSVVFGWEIDRDYFQETKSHLESHPQFRSMKLMRGDIFETDSHDLPINSESTVLIVGNPPWVTNSEQSALGGQNTGPKRNLKSLSGLAAKTGKANFDISEAIILHLVSLVKNAKLAQFALLGKFTVIRNLIQFLRSQPNVGGFEFHRINAHKYFGAAVDAGLIKFRIGRDVKPSFACSLFDNIGGELESTLGLANGRLVYDLPSYQRNSFLENGSVANYIWRQGVKHDVRDVLELRLEGQTLINRLGEKVEIEKEALYHYYKSSDIFHGRAPRYFIPIYQRNLKDTLDDLPERYPRLYSYLNSYRDAFSNRKSSIYKKRNPFAIFGIGDYTHAPFKVAIGGFYSKPVFRILAYGPHRSTVDDTSYTISVDSYEEAEYLYALLNLDCTKEFLQSISYAGDKRRFSKDVLDRLHIPPLSAVPESIRRNLSDAKALTRWIAQVQQRKLF